MTGRIKTGPGETDEREGNKTLKTQTTQSRGKGNGLKEKRNESP
jgi:hypothetical protein